MAWHKYKTARTIKVKLNALNNASKNKYLTHFHNLHDHHHDHKQS